ncbi:MAG: 3-deoxy-manno-octulosonate cytidylyltransferase [Elusimicrobia bacterium]|nr:3-deoxy-manno-octulosonate cytidylyltransferase [Elusimicrobiota bacterium]
MNDFLIVIPARMASTRLPGKVLADLNGRPVVEWCRRAAVRAGLGTVVVATDDPRVSRALAPYNAQVVMTCAKCVSGTDRTWDAVRRLSRLPRRGACAGIRFVMNLQGDEPFVSPVTLRRVAATLRRRPDCDIATAVTRIGAREAADPNSVKTVLTREGRCLYFSRAPIPFPRASSRNGSGPIYWKHLGLYAFRKEALERFIRLPVSPLERRESLEQLRAIEAGMSVHAVEAAGPTVAIDTAADLARARRRAREGRAENTKGATTYG